MLCINKPVGLSSFQVVARIRRKTGVKKVGHAGTLDPFASGVLVVAVGREMTRQIDGVQAMPKGYTVRMVLGIATDTLDPEGRVTVVDDNVGANPSVHRFLTDPGFQAQVVARWIGEIDQLPPRFSAKKIKGVPMYALARQDQEFEVKPSRVRIDEIHVIGARPGRFPTVDLQIRCGKGTYIRSLVRDLAQDLGTVGYAQLLVREFVGDYHLSAAEPLEVCP